MASNNSNQGRGVRRRRKDEVPAAEAEAVDKPRPEPAPGEPSPRAPVYFNPQPGFGVMMLRETCVVPNQWPAFRQPAADASPEEVRAHRTLEQVGSILRRLELEQLEIDRLRYETRSKLQELAA